MSTEVENQVVQMKFNNSAFEQGVAKTMGTLDSLKSKLNFTGAAKGLQNIKSVSDATNFSNMAKSLDTLTSKFSIMNIAGVTAIANIANKAVNAGIQLVKSFTFSPIADGFSQYQQQINATQTILANTQAQGENLKSVTKTLDTLNVYANKTIYNFSDMATNLGTFTSAGIKLNDASQAIKGISNVAAAAGANTQQAASAMYQLSQGLGRGKIIAQDWNSVVAAGMASSNFKTALLETAKAMGTIKMPKTQSIAEWTKAGGSFQEAMGKGQITSDVLIRTLKVMTNDMSEAQIQALGYSKAQAHSLKMMAEQAYGAAANIKTVHALIDNLRQSVGSSYAGVFKTIMGDLPTATAMLTKLSGVLNHIFVDPVENLNKMLKLANHWGANVNFFRSLANIFKALAAVIKPIHDAFRDIFPPMTGRKLASLMIKFRVFTASLIANKEQMENIRKIFKAVFTVLKIGIGIIGFVIKNVFNLFQVIGQLIPGALALLGAFGDAISKVLGYLIHPGPFGKLFHGLDAAKTTVLIPVTRFISQLAEALASLIDGDYSGFTKKLKVAFGSIGDVFDAISSVITDKVSGLADVLSRIGDFFTNIGDKASGSTSGFVRSFGSLAETIGKFLGEFSSSAASKIISMVQNIGQALSDAFSNLSFDSFDLSFGGLSSSVDSGTKSLTKLSVVGTAAKNVWDGVVNAFKKVAEIVGPIVTTIGQIFQAILDKVKNFISGMDFQDAIALINTGFLIALYRSFKGVFKSISGTIDNLGKVFDTLSGSLKQLQRNVTSKIIMRYAIAIGLLAAAVYVLSTIDTKKLGIALGAIAALFVELTSALAVIGKFNTLRQDGILKTGAAMLLLAGSIAVLAIAMKIISTMSWNDIKKGLAALAAMILGLTIIVRAMNATKGVFQAAAGMLILAFALTALAGVLLIYAKFDSISDSLTKIVAVIAFLGLALRAMPVGLPAIAAGMVILAFALGMLVKVLQKLGGMKWSTIVKGLVTLTIALGLIVAATILMEEALPGAAAMLIVAYSLEILADVLKKIGSMGIGAIIKALVTLVALFVVVSVASVFLSAAVPFIAAFGAALLILGAALLAVGAGTYLFASGLALLGTVGFAVIEGFLQLLPLFIQQFGLALIAFAKVVVETAPKLGLAFSAIVSTILDVLDRLTGKVIDVVGHMIVKLIDKVVELTPKFVNAGIQMLLDFLQGLDDHIYEIASRGIRIVTKLITAIGDEAPRLVAAGFSALLAFINALTDAINYYAPEIQKAGAKLALAIVDGITFGLASKGIHVAKSGFDLGKSIITGALGALDSHSPSKEMMKVGRFAGEGLVIGLNAHSRNVGNAAENLGNTAVDKMKASIQILRDAFSGEIDMTPVIAPVIDLSEVRKGAGQMATLLAAHPLNANVSLDQAKVVSTEHEATRQDRFATQDQPTKVAEFKFEQTNNSPDPLSTSEIYRKSQNLLAQARTALGLPEFQTKPA